MGSRGRAARQFEVESVRVFGAAPILNFLCSVERDLLLPRLVSEEVEVEQIEIAGVKVDEN